MSQDFLPVAMPDIGKLEEEYVLEAVRSTWVSSIGEFLGRFEREFADFCQAEHGVAVTNGTDALILALRAAGVKRGDEVVMPALTFAAVPAAALLLGAEPVFVDVDPDYWCLDPRAVQRALSSKTAAIVAVHSYGHPADMDAIAAIASPGKIPVVEDCAEAHGALCRGRKVGSIGVAGCFSFYGNKIITTGEGGMVVTGDSAFAARVRMLKDHAMDPQRRYFHLEAGYNSRMTNLQAALGCAQMRRIEGFLAARDQILEWYREELADVEGLRFNPRMPWARPVNWITCAVLEPRLAAHRDRLLDQLRSRGIDTRPFFLPCSIMPPYLHCRTQGVEDTRLPCTERLSASGFNLPTHAACDRPQVQRVAGEIRRALSGIH